MGADYSQIDPIFPVDDFLAGFHVGGFEGHNPLVHGQIARLGAQTLDPILRRHALPDPVAQILGDALTLASLLGAALKFDGRLIVQLKGDGMVDLVLAEYQSAGGLRGFARFAAPDALPLNSLAPGRACSLREIMGDGIFTLSIDSGAGADVYQGITPLEGDNVEDAAQAFFRQSDQFVAQIRLATGQIWQNNAGPGAGQAPPRLTDPEADPTLAPQHQREWRSGGMLLYPFARDEARRAHDDDWQRLSLYTASLREDELIDPLLPPGRVLHRLFHEDGVAIHTPRGLHDRCSCNRERLIAVIRSFDAQDMAEATKRDGLVHARCEFCARDYVLEPEELLPEMPQSDPARAT